MRCLFLFLQFLQHFIPNNAYAKGIANSSQGFKLAIEVLQVMLGKGQNSFISFKGFLLFKIHLYM